MLVGHERTEVNLARLTNFTFQKLDLYTVIYLTIADAHTHTLSSVFAGSSLSTFRLL